MPLPYVALFVLQAISKGRHFGFDIMEATSLPSGSIYPALRRLESTGLVASNWEADDRARKAGRPRRRNYQLTKAGRTALAENAGKYQAVVKLFGRKARA
jgi:PadR family transcriptional regulator, regulatory protein PadR